ncbi:MAG: protoheme IX farnesyltransferase, partial [Sulfolobales archaeon]
MVAVRGVLLKGYNALEILSDLFKIRQSLLLMFTGMLGYLIAGGLSIDPWISLYLLIALSLTIFGTTGINMVLDADIDSMMVRTKRRAIPRGAISRGRAALISIAFLAAGLWVSYMINLWVFIAGLLGFLIDIPIYTVMTKRRSWTSVIYGGFAGGMPAFGGYMAYTGHPTPEALILLILVAVWSNAHIWYIVIYNYRDYERAGIPMLPVVKGVRAGVMGSLIHVFIMLSLIAIYFILTGFRAWVTLVVGGYLSLRLIQIMRRHLNGVTREEAYRTFKFLSPYLA